MIFRVYGVEKRVFVGALAPQRGIAAKWGVEPQGVFKHPFALYFALTNPEVSPLRGGQ